MVFSGVAIYLRVKLISYFVRPSDTIRDTNWVPNISDRVDHYSTFQNTSWLLHMYYIFVGRLLRIEMNERQCDAVFNNMGQVTYTQHMVGR